MTLAHRITGAAIVVGDFDGNGHKDVYAVGSCPDCAPKTDQPDVLLLNNGSGSFTPQTSAALPPGMGCGQMVSGIDYDQDGPRDFLVLNGRKKVAGPLQLLSYK